jgi:hypothetical protein
VAALLALGGGGGGSRGPESEDEEEGEGGEHDGGSDERAVRELMRGREVDGGKRSGTGACLLK